MLLRNALSMCRRVTPLWQAQFSTLFGGDPINGTTAQELQIGIQFPLDENGGRSTIASGKSIIAAALRGAQTEEGDRLALSSETEKDWRLNYPKHFLDLVKYAATSPDINLKIARAGLHYAHNHFTFIDGNGDMSSLADYINNAESKESFGTVRIDGSGQRGGAPVEVWYKGEGLTGETLAAKLDEWVTRGCIENGAADAIKAISIGRESIDLSGKHFVLLGAGSAMSPLLTLLRHGATVVCVDIPGSMAWQAIVEAARASSGSVIIPIAGDVNIIDGGNIAQAAGCDLMRHPAEVLNWLSDIAKDHPLTVGNYTYLDGEQFVRLSVCADAVMAELCRRHRETAIAFLGSPNDIHVIPVDAVKAQQDNYLLHEGRGLEKGFHNLTKGKFFVLNELPPIVAEDGRSMYFVDGALKMQGPNYLLAKRLQHWRSMVEYEAGHTVFAAIAPVTRTKSVLSNETFRATLAGLPYFKPIEIFDQDTSSSLLAALLISNIGWEGSPANPLNRDTFEIRNGLEMFKHNSVHGGGWRCGYKVDSIQKAAVVVNNFGGPDHFWLLARLTVSTVITSGYATALYAVGLL